jgi:predicted PP-loop superfamily ATPase
MHRFVAGSASPAERREIVRHLLARCGRCAALLRSAVRPPVREAAYEDVIARAVSSGFLVFLK